MGVGTSVLQERPHAHPAGPAQGWAEGAERNPQQRRQAQRGGRKAARSLGPHPLCHSGRGRGGFRPGWPAQGHEEALRRLRGTTAPWRQILPEPNLGSGQAGQPSRGSLQESLRRLTKGEKANPHRALTVCLATRRALRAWL